MEYIFRLASQTRGCLMSLGFGLLVGVLYDILRVIRLTLTKSKIAVYVFDTLFVFLASTGSFLFMLTVTDGQLRAFIVFGELLGFFVYYFSFGVIAVKFTTKTAEKIKAFFKRIFNMILAPFKKIFVRVSAKITENIKKLRKNVQKSLKKSKFLLQIDNSLLYNLIDKKRIFLKFKRKNENNRRI